MKKIMVILVLLGVGLSPATAPANPDVIETGRLLAVLLDSGRVTIGANQPLINVCYLMVESADSSSDPTDCWIASAYLGIRERL